MQCLACCLMSCATLKALRSVRLLISIFPSTVSSGVSQTHIRVKPTSELCWLSASSFVATDKMLSCCPCRFLVVSLRNLCGRHCASHLLCPQCYQRHSHHAAASFQRQEPPDHATGWLKKQSSTIGSMSSSHPLADAGSLGIIAADTRYSGQQVLTSARQNSPSPENPSLMELSRRGLAPRQV